VEFEEYLAPLDRWFENRVVTTGNEIVAFSRDITDRKRAETGLRQSEARFRRLFEDNPLPLMVVDDRTLQFLAVNAAACTRYGYRRDEFLRMRIRDLRPPEDFPKLERVIDEMAAGVVHLAGVHRHVRKDGSLMDVEINTQIIDYGGQRARLGIIVDVTERERLFRAEQEAREQAERANQAKTEFLATMSHELRTPLNAIAGYAELMELGIHGSITPQQQEALRRIQRSQRHLLSLINDVLNFAKLSAGRVEYRLASVPVREAVSEVEPLVMVQIESKSLDFDCSACDGNAIVHADPEKLQQILLNLLSNSIKFTDEGGRITLSCNADGEMVSIVVEDSGIGIAADRLTQIFEPFVQVDRRLTSNHEGTGLGLAISRDLARAMGGDITVESEPGRGSRFAVLLPKA
jgi:PAS domain S-box-containing protein